MTTQKRPAPIPSKGSDPCARIDSHLQTPCKEECPDKDIAQHSCLVYRRSAKVHIDPPARIDQDEAAEIVAQQEAGLLESGKGRGGDFPTGKGKHAAKGS